MNLFSESAVNGQIKIDILIPAVKISGILLDKNIENQVIKLIKEKINLQNVALYYQFADAFKLRALVKETFRYIERCFTMVCKTKTFLQLDFTHVNMIINSCQLDVCSEVEVLKAADDWVSFSFDERRKFAKDLLLKVRLNLLSDPVLTQLFCEKLYSSVFRKIEECNMLEVLQEVLQTKSKDKSSVKSKPRYCNQKNFDIVICGGLHSNGKHNLNVKLFDGKSFESVRSVTELPEYGPLLVVNAGSLIYTFTYLLRQNTFVIHKYSILTNRWKNLKLNYCVKGRFSLCGFLNKIYILGGREFNYDPLSCCFQLNMDTDEFGRIAQLNERRHSLASAVFEGRIVVSGGVSVNNHNLNTVEEYDHVGASWSYMPNMIEGRTHHHQVAVRNKLYVIGGQTQTCEVFDRIVNKFVLVRPPPSLFTINASGAFSIGNEILIFKHNSAQLIRFDFVKNQWDEILFEVPNKYYRSMKMPKILDL